MPKLLAFVSSSAILFLASLGTCSLSVVADISDSSSNMLIVALVGESMQNVEPPAALAPHAECLTMRLRTMNLSAEGKCRNYIYSRLLFVLSFQGTDL